MKKTFKLGMLTFLIVSMLIGLLACPNNHSIIEKKLVYEKVSFANLEIKLAGATDNEVYYIELTDMTKEDVKTNLKRILTKTEYKDKKLALKLPNSVEGLTDMNQAFISCKNLVSLANIPVGVTNMTACFSLCINLESVPTIPATVTLMPGCFNACKSLTSAPKILGNVENFQMTFRSCDNLTEAPEIPDSVTNLRSCFQNCSKLVEAPIIPANVSNMWDCFNGCSSLTKCKIIPETVTNMKSCFKDCSKLVEAPIIPASVTSLCSTFQNCSKLNKITINTLYGSLTCKKDAFTGCTALSAGSIKVPSESLTDYQNSDNATEMGTAKENFAAQ